MNFIGIDPGQSGGLAIKSESSLQTYAFKNMTEKDISNLFKEIAIFSSYGEKIMAFAYLEKVHSMPKQGVSSSFKFGEHFGLLKGLLLAHDIPHDFVSPQKWQKEMNCLTGGDKNITKSLAQRLFPEIKITHAIADAILIAEYCWRIKK